PFPTRRSSDLSGEWAPRCRLPTMATGGVAHADRYGNAHHASPTPAPGGVDGRTVSGSLPAVHPTQTGSRRMPVAPGRVGRPLLRADPGPDETVPGADRGPGEAGGDRAPRAELRRGADVHRAAPESVHRQRPQGLTAGKPGRRAFPAPAGESATAVHDAAGPFQPAHAAVPG